MRKFVREGKLYQYDHNTLKCEDEKDYEEYKKRRFEKLN
jgi:hypothetical protein